MQALFSAARTHSRAILHIKVPSSAREIEALELPESNKQSIKQPKNPAHKGAKGYKTCFYTEIFEDDRGLNPFAGMHTMAVNNTYTNGSSDH